jgi:hypothetical protein
MSALRVYTANFADYDAVHEPRCIDHPYFCFTDAQSQSPGRGAWRTLVVERRQKTPARENRWYKTHSHELFPHAEWTLYFDASLEMQRCPLDFLEWCGASTGRRDADLYLFAHPERDCLFDEAAVCVQAKKDARETIDAHVERYRQRHFAEHLGLWQGGVLLRRNSANVKQFNEMWWWEILNGSHRDQISLPVVLTFSRIPFATLPAGALTDWFAWRADHSAKKGVAELPAPPATGA